MISESQLTHLIEEKEFYMEGLEKNFWRLIKLYEPEVWDNENAGHGKRVWVVGLMGHWCVYHVGEEDTFCIGSCTIHGEIEPYAFKPTSLERLVQDVIQSRFKIG